jgi:hypothetical protein
MLSPAPLDTHVVLSPEWLEFALSSRYPGIRVGSASVVDEFTTVATKARFRVDYEANPGDAAPTGLCVKAYFKQAGTSIVTAGKSEAAFYASVAPRLDIEVPPCVYTGVDPETGHGLVIMIDLIAAGCTFLTALSPYSVDQAAATLEQLARLHTTQNPIPAGADQSGMLPGIGSLLNAMDEERLQSLLDDGRADSLSPGLRQAARLRSAISVLDAHSKKHNSQLIHADAHAGNLYLTPSGQPGIIDWQVYHWGAWELDVAYHLSAVFEQAERAKHERALLNHYLDAVRSRGGVPPAPDDAWEAYRRALVYGYYMWGITWRTDRTITEIYMDRMGAAVQEHESFERLGL